MGLGDKEMSGKKSDSGIGSSNIDRYTTAEINALTGMIEGDAVFDTDLDVIKIYSGSVWEIAGSSPETVESLFDVFLPVTVRNQELDNTDVSGTRWAITAHDTGAKTITLDNDLPFLNGLNNRSSVYDYWGLYVNYYELVKIESVNYATKTITYSSIVGSLSVSEEVTFFNPFRKGRILSTSALLGTPYAWCSSYNQPAGMWKHSDGTYRMLVNGYSSYMQAGIASSSDLVTWAYIGTTPIFTSGKAPLDKSWMATGGVFSVSNPVKIPDTDNLYYLLLTVKNVSALWETVILIVDEDMTVIKVAENPIVITGHANTHGNQAGGIIYHDGVYKLFIINRAAALQDWTIYEMEMGDPITGVVGTPVEVIKGTGTNIWYGSHTDATGLLVYKGKLYVFVGGTGSASFPNEIYSGNRQYGVFTKVSGVWTNYKSNPVFCNPVEGETIWGSELLWATDHIGGYFANIIEDGFLYLYVSMNNGSNTYRTAGMKFDLTV